MSDNEMKGGMILRDLASAGCHIYIYIYTCVCVSVCVFVCDLAKALLARHRCLLHKKNKENILIFEGQLLRERDP